MLSKEKSINIFLAVLTPFALAAVVWAVRGVTAERVLDPGVITLSALTVFCGCYLRIQLPRVNIHLTISDGLIILSMLIYGGEIALLLAVVETTLASLNIRRQGVTIKAKTMLINTYFAAIAVFVAAKVVTYVFVSVELIRERDDNYSFMWLLGLMAISMFLVNSVLAAIFSALKKERSFWKVWTENCFSAMIMYLTGAVVAGITDRALHIQHVDIYLVAAVVGFFGVIYLTFRRFVNDVKKTVEKAKQAERERAEQAEQHVGELQHYVAELERSGEALQESHENFRHAAYHDALTGLPNRNFFIDTQRGLLQQTRENSESNFAVLFLDLHRFKTNN